MDRSRNYDYYWLGLVVHACNPSSSEGRARGITVQVQLKEKHEILFENQTEIKDCVAQVVEAA
jgi:hypothetical protein